MPTGRGVLALLRAARRWTAGTAPAWSRWARARRGRARRTAAVDEVVRAERGLADHLPQRAATRGAGAGRYSGYGMASAPCRALVVGRDGSGQRAESCTRSGMMAVSRPSSAAVARVMGPMQATCAPRRSRGSLARAKQRGEVADRRRAGEGDHVDAAPRRAAQRSLARVPRRARPRAVGGHLVDPRARASSSRTSTSRVSRPRGEQDAVAGPVRSPRSRAARPSGDVLVGHHRRRSSPSRVESLRGGGTDRGQPRRAKRVRAAAASPRGGAASCATPLTLVKTTQPVLAAALSARVERLPRGRAARSAMVGTRTTRAPAASRRPCEGPAWAAARVTITTLPVRAGHSTRAPLAASPHARRVPASRLRHAPPPASSSAPRAAREQLVRQSFRRAPPPGRRAAHSCPRSTVAPSTLATSPAHRGRSPSSRA